MTQSLREILTGGEDDPCLMPVNVLKDYLGYLERRTVRALILAEDDSDDPDAYDDFLREVKWLQERLAALVAPGSS